MSTPRVEKSFLDPVLMVCKVCVFMNKNTVNSTVRAKKKEYDCAVRRNISLPPSLDRIADQIAAKYSFSSFSDYVQARLRKDAGIELAA
jgi:hypothetical protein